MVCLCGITWFLKFNDVQRQINKLTQNVILIFKTKNSNFKCKILKNNQITKKCVGERWVIKSKHNPETNVEIYRNLTSIGI